MRREIADSDDELDVVAPPRTSTTNIAGETTATYVDMCDEDQLDPVLSTAFDEFLSPTQRLSSYDSNYENTNDVTTSKFLDSSTNRFLDALGPSSHSSSYNTNDADPTSQLTEPTMGGKRIKGRAPVHETVSQKRTWAQIEAGDAAAMDGKTTRKRAKSTNTTSSRPSAKLRDAHGFEIVMGNAGSPTHDGQPSGDIIDNPSEMVSIDARTNYTSPLDLSFHLSPSHGAQPTANDRSVTGAASAQGYMPSDMYTPQGNFFGANLRGGTASSSSMGNYQSFSINPERLGMDFDKINPFGSLSQVSLPGDLDSEETRGISDIFRNNASYSTKTSLTNATEMSADMAHAAEYDMQTSPVKSDGATQSFKNRHTERSDAQCSPPFSPITNPDDQNLVDQKRSVPVDKLEARPEPKKRGRKPKNQKVIDVPDIELNGTDELQMDEQPVNRATRAGTVDSVSNLSEVSQGTSSSRNGKKQKSRKSDMGPPELQSKKLPSSDLGLDNKEIIGLSPERYVPRPSKRRGQIDSQPRDTSETMQEAEGEDVEATDATSSKATPGKGKKGRKSKAKGAKAAAAAVKKQDRDPPTEDENNETKDEELMQLQMSHKLESDRKPEVETMVEEANEDEDEDIVKGALRRTKISVDIPVLPRVDDQPDPLPPIAEPKKRGRKRKKPLEEAPVNPDEEAQRPALEERDANIPLGTKKAKTKDTEAPLEADADQQDENDINHEKDMIDQQKEETPVRQSGVTTTTPSDITTPSVKQNRSALKPMSSTPLFNARARIGLSNRHSIPSLLRRVDRNKEAPKAIEKKEKLNKAQLAEKEQERIAKEEADAEGREYKPLHQLRGKDGLLVEWDF